MKKRNTSRKDIILNLKLAGKYFERATNSQSIRWRSVWRRQTFSEEENILRRRNCYRRDLDWVGGKTKNSQKRLYLYLQKYPNFWTFETISWIPASNRFFWLEPIYWDINFGLKCLPAQCAVGGQHRPRPWNRSWSSDCVKQKWQKHVNFDLFRPPAIRSFQ